ncbi:2-oxoacid:ferredoxin oxidoreductase subunit beta [Photobacterium sp. MCCC 1A19761]|uniref:2-oxoacid:ferredoxin oxidoreductase subunit beta n=1 Tax=Photobacterium sp. MCCC 1A19761 TaxID=3115000 RepID=UPI00307DEB8B
MMGVEVLNRKDFASATQIKWCRGCGDFNVLKTMQAVLVKTGRTRENSVFISGIGCSSRFPYYLDTYGFHTIHGRAPAIATGVKAVNPDLDVWVITGDGDALSIGGNHFVHAIRRNQDIKILLFNNAVYGLTKGQFSPTSSQGAVSKSSPLGSPDHALRPLALAASADATFIARTSDNDPAHMTMVFEAAANHQGTAVVEILQNCVIFNDQVHEPYNGVNNRDEQLLYLKNNEPLLFGKDQSNALVSDGFGFKVAKANNACRLVHDPAEENAAYTFALASLSYPEFPVPVGIFRQIQRPTFDHVLTKQQSIAIQKNGPGDLKALLQKNSYQRLI